MVAPVQSPKEVLSSLEWPYYSADELEAVQRVLESGRVNYWTGQEGRQFEKEYATYLNVPHTVAVANGTVALELGLRALGIGPGDEVLVTPRSFFASVSSIVMVGAKPVFVDVDRNSQNIDPALLESRVTARTRAVLTVHLAGWPCDMDLIGDIAGRYDLRVVEDCAQAHGAMFNGKAVGSFGDVAAFSFCQDKILSTCGEGGMLACKNSSIWERAWSFKDHGKSTETLKPRSGGVFQYVHESFGTNFRMTEAQAAVGRLQLKKLDSWVERRRHNAQLLNDGFHGLEALRLTLAPENIRHAFYRYTAFIAPTSLRAGWSRDRLVEALQQNGVKCFSGTCPEIYREEAMIRHMGKREPRLPVAKELGETSLSFLVHPTLRESDLSRTIECVRAALAAAVR